MAFARSHLIPLKQNTIMNSARQAIQSYLDAGEDYRELAVTVLEVLVEEARTRFEATGTPELLNVLHVLTVAMRQLEAGGGDPSPAANPVPPQDPEEIAAACRADPAAAETILDLHFGRAVTMLLPALTGSEPDRESTRSVILAARAALFQGRPDGILALMRNELVQFALRCHAVEVMCRGLARSRTTAKAFAADGGARP